MSEGVPAHEQYRHPSISIAVVAGLTAGLALPLLHFATGLAAVPLRVHHLGMVSVGSHHLGTVGVAMTVGLNVMYSIVFAVLFELVYTWRGWRALPLSNVLGIGIGYAGLLWLGGSATTWPMLLRLFNIPDAPPVPHFDPSVVVLHLVYGCTVAVIVWWLTR